MLDVSLLKELSLISKRVLYTSRSDGAKAIDLIESLHTP